LVKVSRVFCDCGHIHLSPTRGKKSRVPAGEIWVNCHQRLTRRRDEWAVYWVCFGSRRQSGLTIGLWRKLVNATWQFAAQSNRLRYKISSLHPYFLRLLSQNCRVGFYFSVVLEQAATVEGWRVTLPHQRRRAGTCGVIAAALVTGLELASLRTIRRINVHVTTAQGIRAPTQFNFRFHDNAPRPPAAAFQKQISIRTTDNGTRRAVPSKKNQNYQDVRCCRTSDKETRRETTPAYSPRYLGIYSELES